MLAKNPAQAKTVLIVEDNELNMKLFNDLLEAHGYRVLQTRDGLTALEIARQHMPDLIIMDIQLPGIDGYEVTRRIKANPALRHIPVIAVTSYALSGDDVKALEAGCDAYVTKPFDPAELLGKIRGYLG